VKTSATPLSYVPSSGKLSAVIFGLSNDCNLISYSASTSSTSPTQIASWPIASYGSAKLIVEATQTDSRHITEIIVTHNGTTAYSTEYASIFTGSPLALYAVDINSGNVRLLSTAASSSVTTYKVMQILMTL
jgi:hypothetical protein